MLKKFLFESMAWYLRHSPIEKGKYRLLTMARPMGREVGRELGRKTVLTKSGFLMEFDLADWIPQEIYLTGEFEATTSKLVKKLLHPGDIAVDVGANIGYFSLLLAQCVGPTGKVYAFEPVSALATQLRRNLELNQFNNVTVSTVALSDHRGSARFYVGPTDNTGLSSFREPRQSSSSFEVQLVRLDELIEDHAQVTFVKIDVEGAELQVLRGMERLLRTRHPNLLVEVTDNFLRELGDSAASWLQYVGQLGYVCYLVGDGRLTLLERSEMVAPKQWNALFTFGHLFRDSVGLV